MKYVKYIQGFGFGNVTTGQVVQKKVEFLQRSGSVGRGDSRDGLNPDIRSDFTINEGIFQNISTGCSIWLRTLLC